MNRQRRRRQRCRSRRVAEVRAVKHTRRRTCDARAAACGGRHHVRCIWESRRCVVVARRSDQRRGWLLRSRRRCLRRGVRLLPGKRRRVSHPCNRCLVFRGLCADWGEGSDVRVSVQVIEQRVSDWNNAESEHEQTPSPLRGEEPWTESGEGGARENRKKTKHTHTQRHTHKHTNTQTNVRGTENRAVDAVDAEGEKKVHRDGWAHEVRNAPPVRTCDSGGGGADHFLCRGRCCCCGGWCW